MKTARWQQSAPGTHVLKARAQDGGTVLATIETMHHRQHAWLLADGRYGVALSLYAAQRRVRKALRGETD